jgi:hypothetical protein
MTVRGNNLFPLRDSDRRPARAAAAVLSSPIGCSPYAKTRRSKTSNLRPTLDLLGPEHNSQIVWSSLRAKDKVTDNTNTEDCDAKISVSGNV